MGLRKGVFSVSHVANFNQAISSVKNGIGKWQKLYSRNHAMRVLENRKYHLTGIANSLCEKIVPRRSGFTIVFKPIRLEVKCGHYLDPEDDTVHKKGKRSEGFWNLGRVRAHIHVCPITTCYGVRLDSDIRPWAHLHAGANSCQRFCLGNTPSFNNSIISADLPGLILSLHGFLTSANCKSPLIDLSEYTHMRL